MSKDPQSTFLEKILASRTPVSVYLKSGIRLNGRLVGVDEHTIMLDQQLIYKHAIATIFPHDKLESEEKK